MKFSAVVTRYFSFIGLSQNNPKWEGSEEVSCSPASVALTLVSACSVQAFQYNACETIRSLSCLGGLYCVRKGALKPAHRNWMTSSYLKYPFSKSGRPWLLEQSLPHFLGQLRISSFP